MTAEIAKKLRSPFWGLWTRCYITSKLKTDPVYAGVHAELKNSTHPLLDIGCGIGLLAFYLRERGLGFPIASLDYDRRKIGYAHRVHKHLRAAGLDFSVHDARQGLPEHSGNVSILDILQFFAPQEQEALLRLAASRVASGGGRLVIRSTLKDDSLRFRTTVAGDLLATFSLWMKGAPRHYPTAEDFRRILSPYGQVRIQPMWGGTPFNNHLIVLEKA